MKLERDAGNASASLYIISARRQMILYAEIRHGDEARTKEKGGSNDEKF